MITVQDILSKKGSDVASIAPNATVVDASRQMNDAGIGGLVVIDGASIVGIFTERDILRRVVATERNSAITPVSEVMTTDVVTCSPDAPIDSCMGLMTAKRIRHMPVVGDHGMCGIITSGDLLAAQVREQQDTIDYLNSYVFDLR